jgi:hypothetical protein
VTVITIESAHDEVVLSPDRAVMMMIEDCKMSTVGVWRLQISIMTGASLKPDVKRSKPTPGYRESLFPVLQELSETNLKSFLLSKILFVTDLTYWTYVI